MITATYSPDDNKIRLYSSTRLDSETYARVKAAGYKWAPRQQLFVAPMWTPEREDLALELAGEIGDEDTTLADRAEERADRFEDYSDNRAADADRAHAAVSAIADNIPLGQPILVGHHSERHARRDAKRIENGMRKAVKMWETSNYWKARAAGAIRHAKYKERPDVRARRIKGLEADKRKQQRNKQEAEMWLKLWTECGNEADTDLQAKVALRIANMCWLHLPRKEGDRPDWSHTPTAYDALTNCSPTLYAPRTLAEIVEHAKAHYPRCIAYADRWIAHIDNRLEYERAMLGTLGPAAAVPSRKYDRTEKPEFQAMKESLRAGVKTVSAPQLFPTPPELAARMVELAEVEAGHRVLEPSAGTGRLIDALDSVPGAEVVAVELSCTLADNLRLRSKTTADIRQGNFLECNGDLGTFDRVLMNPPFERGADIQHIEHALKFVKPGGRLVAICANGSRQQDKLMPLATLWEDLPAGTFKAEGTAVNTALLVIDC